MKNTPLLTLAVLAACTFALTPAGRAQTTVDAPVTDNFRSAGLVGQTHAGVAYSWIDLDQTGIDATAITATLNQNISDALDTLFEYEYVRTDRFAGTRLTQHSLMLGARAFMPSSTFKPFVEGGLGWVWQRAFNTRDNSWAWMAAAGVELGLSPAFSATPYVRYEDVPELIGEGTWNYGLRGNFWLNDRYALLGGVERDDDANMAYTVGFNFRY